MKNYKHFCQRLRIDNEVDNTKPVISYESKVILTNTKYTKEKNAIIAVLYMQDNNKQNWEIYGA